MTTVATTNAQPSSSDPPPPGRTELGLITISNGVVQKLAARAATDISDAGAAAPRVMGHSLSGLSDAVPVGVKKTSLDEMPKASADVNGSKATIDLVLSVRWPASVPSVTQQVRSHVHDRVNELTGLDVTDVQIHVTDLVTDLAPPPRVH